MPNSQIEALITGAPARLPPPRPLRAGPLRASYCDADLRNIRLGRCELIQRVYAAVRDADWNTIPGNVSELSIEDAGHRFEVRFHVAHRRGDIHFAWQGLLTGDEHGTIRCEFDGEALTTFRANRIGCCVLHPASVAARACRVTHGDGMIESAGFPRLVAPEQPVAGFHNVSAIAFEAVDGVWVETACDGDVFEMEDQRNWLDASFKTYSRPLSAPAPFVIAQGARVRQSVTVRLVAPPRHAGPLQQTDGRTARRRTRRVRIAVDDSTQSQRTRIGLAAPDPGVDLSSLRSVIRQLGLSHLRIDWEPGDEHAGQRTTAQLIACAALGLPVELALHLDESAAEPDSVRRLLENSDLSRVLVHQRGALCTTPASMQFARVALNGRNVPLGAGTRGDLFELNAQHPAPGGADFIFWSMTPQWHATDLISLCETPAAVIDQVRTVRRLYPDLPQVVSPVTLLPRLCTTSGAWITGDRPEQSSATDPRQQSLAGAAWTLAMIAQLTTGGVGAATLFECLGPRGIMDAPTANGSRDPSAPRVYPVCFVLAALSGFSTAFRCTSDSQSSVALLALGAGGARRYLVASLCDERQDLELHGVFRNPRVRVLDESNVAQRTLHPQPILPGTGDVVPVSGNRLRLRLQRFGIAQIDDVL